MPKPGQQRVRDGFVTPTVLGCVELSIKWHSANGGRASADDLEAARLENSAIDAVNRIAVHGRRRFFTQMLVLLFLTIILLHLAIRNTCGGIRASWPITDLELVESVERVDGQET